MPPIVAIVATLITAYGLGTVAIVAITLATIAYSAYMMATMERPNQPDSSRRLQTVRSSVQAHRVIYGEVMTGGVLVYGQSHSVDPITLETVEGDNVFISLVVAFTAHEVEEIKEIWLNDKVSIDIAFIRNVPEFLGEGYWQSVYDPETDTLVPTYFEIKPPKAAYTDSWVHVTKYTGTLTQTADPFLVSLPPNPSNLISKYPTEGLNDLSVSGDYTEVGMSVFTITITSSGSPNQFSWVEDIHNGDGTVSLNVNSASNVAITGLDQTLIHGVKIKFNVTTGHSVGNVWEIRAFDGAPWTSDCTLTGRSYVVVTMKKNDKVFPNGLPNIKARIKGNNQIYDPRTTLTGYTDNWALCIRDYLTKPYGLEAPSSDVNDVFNIGSINICDEDVTLANGTTQKRYTLNGSFTVDKSPTTIMNEMLLSAFGAISWTQGQYKILPAVYYSPDSTFYGMNPNKQGLTESDLRGPLKVRPIVSMKDKFNTVKGTYISKETWQPIDFPIVKNSTYITQDGGEIVKDVQLTYITDPARAQRIAKLLLEKNRQSILVDFPAKWSAFPLTVGENVYVSISHLGWDRKIFTVVDWAMNPDGGIDLKLKEDAAGIYDWNSGEETQIDLAQNTLLPDPRFVPVPTGLTVGEELYSTNVVSIIKSRAIVTWDTMNVQQYEVNYLPPNNTIWTPLAFTQDTVCTVDDTIPGVYSFRVRAMNFLGVWGEWTTISKTLLGKSAKPSDVTNFVAVVNKSWIDLSWDHIPDLDRDTYEIRIGSTWDDSILISSGIKSNRYAWQPTLSTNLGFFLIKAIDTTTNYSKNPTVIVNPFSVPFANITNFWNYYVGNNMFLRWDSIVDTRPFVYEIRMGVDYNRALILGTTTNNIFQAQGPGTYWITAKSDFAKSEIPAELLVGGSDLVKNVVQTWDETATGWLGTVSGGAEIDGVGRLWLKTVVNPSSTFDLVDEMGNTIVDENNNTLEATKSVTEVSPLGYYEIPTAHVVNVGSIQTVNISVSFDPTSDSPFALVDDIASIDDVGNWDGDYSGNSDVSIQIAMSQDGSTWGAWQNFVPGPYVGWKFKLRLVLTSTSPSVTPVVNQFSFTVDMDDKFDLRTSLAIAAGGTAITYANPFQIVPNVQVTIVNAVAGDKIGFLAGPTVNGLTLQITNGGTGVARTCNILSQAY